MAGGTGALGSEVLRRLAGSGAFAQTAVLTTEPMTTGLSQVSLVRTEAGAIDDWPSRALAETGIVMFEPPRLYHDRERAFWTPAPEDLLALARWLKRCGVTTLAVVVPHSQGRLPDAIRRGLANLDEQAIAALGFERLLLVRSAQKRVAAAPSGLLPRTAAQMLSIFGYMLPAADQPLRPARLAEFIALALQWMPPGTHIASPELLWQAAHGKATGLFGGKAAPTSSGHMQAFVQAWLNSPDAAQPLGEPSSHGPAARPPDNPPTRLC
ncbi:MAG: hypothetical protein JWP47_2460 [Polaromonas sp.]|nr:hypothetical protein [Polaromonas sp.]